MYIFLSIRKYLVTPQEWYMKNTNCVMNSNLIKLCNETNLEMSKYIGVFKMKNNKEARLSKIKVDCVQNQRL
jgi:hypothetical protein